MPRCCCVDRASSAAFGQRRSAQLISAAPSICLLVSYKPLAHLQVRDREGVPREAYQTERIAPEVYVKDIDLETPPATLPANPALFVRR